MKKKIYPFVNMRTENQYKTALNLNNTVLIVTNQIIRKIKR